MKLKYTFLVFLLMAISGCIKHNSEEKNLLPSLRSEFSKGMFQLDSLKKVIIKDRSNNDTIVLGFLAGMSKDKYDRHVKNLIKRNIVKKIKNFYVDDIGNVTIKINPGEYINIEFLDIDRFDNHVAINNSFYLDGALRPKFINDKLVEVGISYVDGEPHPKNHHTILNIGRYVDKQVGIDSMKTYLTKKYGVPILHHRSQNDSLNIYDYYWSSKQILIRQNQASEYPAIRSENYIDNFDVIYTHVTLTRQLEEIEESKKNKVDSLKRLKESIRSNKTKLEL
jgi:hypothetical protein